MELAQESGEAGDRTAALNDVPVPVPVPRGPARGWPQRDAQNLPAATPTFVVTVASDRLARAGHR
jgi:hypothetical protein